MADSSLVGEDDAYTAFENQGRSGGRLSHQATVRGSEKHWQRLVERLETTGYEFVLDEYKAEIGARQLLEWAITELSQPWSELLAARTAPWDARFRKATVEAAHAFWSGGWWAERLPAKGSPLFEESARDYREAANGE